MNLPRHPLYPLILRPAYQHYVWGGGRIPKIFHRPLPPGIYAESWEVSDRPEGPSVVADGALEGWTLNRVIANYGSEALGAAMSSGICPWLIKLIDARERLSVQVHPDRRAAAANGGEPKTEAWYVLDAAPGAVVYAGFKPGVNEPDLRQALADAGVEKLLEKVPVSPGDLIYVPGGLAHAIGAGCLLLEVQQNSNTTYRVYDWGRRGADGQPRELHIEQALRAMHWDARPEIARAAAAPPGRWQTLLHTPFFDLGRLVLTAADPPAALPRPARCQALFVVSGAARLEAPGGWAGELPAGSSVFLPAAVRGCRLAPAAAAEAILVA